MAASVKTEMRIPTRIAPRPPVNIGSRRNISRNTNNDTFGSNLLLQPGQKKKPPPRPPPPKFNSNLNNQYSKDGKSKKTVKPSELLSNLFGRKIIKTEQSCTNMSSNNSMSFSQSQIRVNESVSLIDLSPPSSPTLTTRSSSDGVSVDSLSSDGNSNPSLFPSSGNISQAESGFEDDFDFFGLVSSKKYAQNDPWQAKDPFSPTNNNHKKQQPLQSMPTIIRAKPSKPPAPKIMKNNLDSFRTSSGSGSSRTWNNTNQSLPMPTVPPPAPPIEYLIENNDKINKKEEDFKKPYGVALYDFSTTHSDDLPFKQGDVITLLRCVSDDWLFGRLGNREGMFPVSFIDIKIPLPGYSNNIVTALYTFKAEAYDDLSFQEGSKITVLSKISDDWLFGECEGKQGQFPATYVNRIPNEFR